MNNNTLISDAEHFAWRAHMGQTRKFTGEPYFNHVASVAEMVSHRTQDAELIAAAYLHDTVEDCGVTHQELCHKFSKRVADLVQSLTNDDQAIERIGKVAYMSDKLRHLTADALLIKLCDMLHNRSNTQSQRQIDNYLAILANLASAKPVCWNEQHEQLLQAITAGAPIKKCPRCGGAWGFRYVYGADDSSETKGIMSKGKKEHLAPTYLCGYCCHDFGFARRGDAPAMAEEISRVVFAVGGHWGPSYYFEISEESATLESKEEEPEIILPGEESMPVATFPVQPDEFRGFVRKLYRQAYLGSWQQEYVDHDVFEGTQWELELYRKGTDEAITYYGSNKFPPYYGTLLSLIRPYFKRFQLPFERR